MRTMGFEPTHPFGHHPLKMARLPFRHVRVNECTNYYNIVQVCIESPYWGKCFVKFKTRIEGYPVMVRPILL